MKHIIAIDPGVSGAITVISGIENPEIIVYDTPCYTKILKGKKKKDGKHKTKQDYDKPGMVKILKPFTGKDVIVYLESVSSRPGEGSVSSFNFGKGLGIWEGIIAAFEFEFVFVTPLEWKKEYGDKLLAPKMPLPKVDDQTYNRMSLKERKAIDEQVKIIQKQKREGKENAKRAARELAGILYPKLIDQFKLIKNDGRAESLLMAERGRRIIERGQCNGG